MGVYNINGALIADNGGSVDYLETPYLSASMRNRMKEQSDFDMSSFDLIRAFTEFGTDYSTATATPRVLSITQADFYSTFYDSYLGYHDGLLVTKKNLGKDQSGTYDVWCYDFIPYKAKKKILLTSAMHTYELPASFGLARWIKDYMESTDAVFQYMRQNVHISIIPIVNPWGFNQNPKKYGNVNGVNPNRNFDGWNGEWEDFPTYTPSQNEWNVKGAAPFSEAETKILSTWLKNNTDADFWIDCHTGLGCSRSSYGDVWCLYTSTNPNVSKIRAAINALKTHISSTYAATAKEYIQIDADSFIKGKYATNVIGIPTMTIEQAQGEDTTYQTVPNNSAVAIQEYATQIHAYIVAQLQ